MDFCELKPEGFPFGGFDLVVVFKLGQDCLGEDMVLKALDFGGAGSLHFDQLN